MGLVAWGGFIYIYTDDIGGGVEVSHFPTLIDVAMVFFPVGDFMV